MRETLEAELEHQQAIAQTACKRFMASAALLRRSGLSSGETSKAQAIHSEALGTLTTSLMRISEILATLHPAVTKEPEWQPAPRYSSDVRRIFT